MSTSRNGVILLGYARSAGSGDQPVPGTVTSRRDRGNLKQQQAKKLAQQEEDRKVKQRQEVAAQYLKRKWKEEKNKKKGRDKDGDEEYEPAQDKEPATDDIAEDDVDDAAEQEQPGGKWVSVADANIRTQQIEMRAREAPRTGGGPLPVQTPAADRAAQQKRKKALAGAFGLDDDDGEARRELELAARIKRQRVEARPPPGEPATAVIAGPVQAGAPPLGTMNMTPAVAQPGGPMDMYDQLRKLAEWKRQCKGNRRPMPDDMVAAIAGTAGINHHYSAGSSSHRSPSRSRSRSRGGQRRFSERRRRSRSGRRRRSRS